MTEKIEPQKPAETAIADMPLNEKMVAVIKEYVDAAIAQVKLDVQKRMLEIKKEAEDELVTSVKTGLGLQKDNVVHMSEIEGMVRKILLDAVPPNKKTLTETPDKPAEGDVTKTQKIDMETQFNTLIKSKGAL